VHKYVLVTIIGIALAGAGPRSYTASAVAGEGQESAAVLLPDGTAKSPSGFRRWVFVGAPLTPEGLNDAWKVEKTRTPESTRGWRRTAPPAS
jgi:hypothetical protein